MKAKKRVHSLTGVNNKSATTVCGAQVHVEDATIVATGVTCEECLKFMRRFAETRTVRGWTTTDG